MKRNSNTTKKTNKNNTLEPFEIIAYLAASIVVVFMFLIISTIFIKGIPYIKDAFFTKEVQFSIKLSMKTTSISTLICMLLAIPTSYAFTKLNFPLKKMSQILIELPLCLPYLVLGVSLLIVFSSPAGKFLKSIGIKVVYSQHLPKRSHWRHGRGNGICSYFIYNFILISFYRELLFKQKLR